mgnify:CR=1 FL=1
MPGKKGRIAVYEGDTAKEVIERFRMIYWLNAQRSQVLFNILYQKMKEHKLDPGEAVNYLTLSQSGDDQTQKSQEQQSD